MDHATDVQLLSHRDREDSDLERVRVRRHVEGCGACHGRLAGLDTLVAGVSGALAVLRPPPARRPDFDVLVARARVAGPLTRLTRPMPVPITPDAASIQRWVRAALVLLAVTGTAGAAAVVVNQWAAHRDAASVFEPVRQVPPPAVQPQTVTRSGVTVLPDAGHIVVAVRGAAAGTTVEIGVVDTREASAFVRGDGEGVRFSARTGWIDVDATGRVVALEVRLPEGATSATLEVDGAVRARKIDAGVRVEPGRTDVSVRVRTRP